MDINTLILSFNSQVTLNDRRYDEDKTKDIATSLLSLCAAWKEKINPNASLKLKIEADATSFLYGISIDTLPLTILKIIASNRELPKSIELLSYDTKTNTSIGILDIS